MPKTRTNISLDSDLLSEARKAGLNVSGLAEAALREALRQDRARRWHEDNAKALEARRRWIEEHGTALARYQVLKIDG